MNKKSGFTIVELLAVIALLGVILTISIISISSISSSIKERQKVNLESELRMAAQKYTADKGITKVYVQTLITEGYIEADNEDKKIINPIDNSELNCYYFYFISN